MRQNRAIEIFCCYAKEDILYLNKLKKHLSPFQRQGMIHVWHDGDIRAGTEWNQELRKYLNEANVILLLISPDFNASEDCYHTEMEHALERHKQGEARVIPIFLRPVAGWETLSFGDIQLGHLRALPTNGQAVTTWTNDDLVWKDVAEGIGRVANELLQPSSRPPKEVNAVSTYHSEMPEPIFDESSIEPLVNALLSAFPSSAELKLLVAYELHQNIEIIAPGNGLEEKVLNLVTWAMSSGRVDELIKGALNRKPGNPKLRKFALDHGF